LPSITVAILQPPLERLACASNFETLRAMVEELVAERTVDLIVLPEAMDGAVPEPGSQATAVGDAPDGPSFVADLARRARAHVVGGSVSHLRDDGRVVNACFVADRAGALVGEYDKRKLFATEADSRTAGQGPGVFDLDGLRVGVLICADLWYPELARELGGRVDVLCVPAKTTVSSADFVPYARTLWWSMAMTRAVENALPVLVSDWCERAHGTYVTAGASSLNDPAGRPDVNRLQRRMDRGQSGVLVGQIDLDAVAQIRQYRQAVGLLDRRGAGD